MSVSFSPGSEEYLYIAYLLLIFSLVLVFLSTRRLVLGLSSNGWIGVKAKVLSVMIDQKEDSDKDTWFEPKVSYIYKLVDGKTYRSSRFSYRLLSTMDYSDALRYIHGISAGGQIRVYFNPNSKRQSVVVKGVNFSNYLEVLCTFIFFGLIINGIYLHYTAVGP